MTEDEAKTKWCPFARQATLQTEDHYGTTQPAGPVANRWVAGPHSGGRKPKSRITLCMASACMAWRRSVAMFDRSTGEPAVPGVAAIGDLEPRYTSHGYCGLAGSPQ